MSGLISAGSIVLGPTGGGSSGPTTLPEYLASIGKNSWYARFIVGTDLWTGTNLTGSAVTLDSATTIGSWGYDTANTSNFTAYWTTTGGTTAQPYYKTQNGVGAVVGTGNSNGAGDQRYMQLTSTTALNGAYSMIVRVPLLYRDSKSVYSHNGTTVYFSSAAGAGTLISVAASGQSAIDQIIHVVRSTPGTSSANCLIGISQTGTGHNNFAPYLGRRSSAYGESAVREIWFTPQLTATELDNAMVFVT